MIVGLSGGVDSVVLLHLLAQARKAYGLTLTAVHVHHGLSPYADDWADFCAKLCADWKILLHIKRIHLKNKQMGVEAAARLARYAAFREVATAVSGDCLVVAHHRDDQVETFLLAALRGAGVRGLVAMPDEWDGERLSGCLKVARPLLPFSRQAILAYAAQHQLKHIEDDSNHNPIYLRNWVRNHWLPPLRLRLPHADSHILAAIELLQDELAVLNEINESDQKQIYPKGLFDIPAWRHLSAVRRRQQLVLFAKRHQLGTPRRASVIDCERMLLDNDDGAEWGLPNGKALAYRGILFGLQHNWETALAWHQPLSGSLKHLAAQSGMTFQSHPAGLPNYLFHQNRFTLRAARADDVLPMKVGSKSIKKLLAQHGVPPFLREHYPILLDENGVCLAVVGLAVNQHLAVKQGVLPVCEALNHWQIADNEVAGK